MYCSGVEAITLVVLRVFLFLCYLQLALVLTGKFILLANLPIAALAPLLNSRQSALSYSICTVSLSPL
jgi:hypothetical protein